MADYSVKTGLWKSLKNTLVVLLPALGAAYAAFVANVPDEYKPIIMGLGGFAAYLVKNYLSVNEIV